MKKLILISLLIGMTSCTAKEERSIKLNVNHTVQIPVEFVTATVMINEYGSDPVEVERLGYKNLARVVGMLKNNGLQKDEIEIEAGQLSTAYYRREDPYEFHSKVTFDILDLDKIDSFRRAIVGMGGSAFQVTSYGNHQEDEIYDEAYRNAIDASKERAEKLLANQSERIGRILNLQEDIRHTVGPKNASQNERFMAMNETFDMEAVDPMFRIEFYTKSIQFYIEFEID